MSFARHYPHLAARVFNTPLLVHPQKLDAIRRTSDSRDRADH